MPKVPFRRGVETVVVFDLDDTLAPERDFVLSGIRSLRDMLCADFGEAFSEDAITVMNDAANRGRNHYSALEDLARRRGVEVDMKRVVSACREHMPDSGYALVPGASLLLDRLRGAGIPIGIITDGRSVTQRNKLQSLGLTGYVDEEHLYISGERGHDKHSPEPFKHFMRLHPEARRMVYVGDNPAKDFLQANLLGWETVMLRDSGRNVHPQVLVFTEIYYPTRIIDEFGELDVEK